jgi:hypothetical protein
MRSLTRITAFLWLAFGYGSVGLGVRAAWAVQSGVDYAIGEIVVTFRPEYMPSELEVTMSPPSFGITAVDSIIEALDGTGSCQPLDRPVPPSTRHQLYMARLGRVQAVQPRGACVPTTMLPMFC